MHTTRQLHYSKQFIKKKTQTKIMTQHQYPRPIYQKTPPLLAENRGEGERCAERCVCMRHSHHPAPFKWLTKQEKLRVHLTRLLFFIYFSQKKCSTPGGSITQRSGQCLRPVFALQFFRFLFFAFQIFFLLSCLSYETRVSVFQKKGKMKGTSSSQRRFFFCTINFIFFIDLRCLAEAPSLQSD